LPAFISRRRLSIRMHGQPPVIIEPYNSAWPAKCEEECRRIAPILEPWLVAPLEHIGSTAVPGLPAKAIIDIMGAVRDLQSSRPAIEVLRPFSYCYFPYKADSMHWFCKPSDLERTHHLHLIPIGSELWQERLAFRNHLRIDPATRQAYSGSIRLHCSSETIARRTPMEKQSSSGLFLAAPRPDQARFFRRVIASFDVFAGSRASRFGLIHSRY
jgi:GrpB-like predicted nucleotidyltransferase (UPF0157 family)